MNRKSFIRNTLLGLCASLLPEVLRPMDVLVKRSKTDDEILEWAKQYQYVTTSNIKYELYWYQYPHHYVKIDKSLLPAKSYLNTLIQ